MRDANALQRALHSSQPEERARAAKHLATLPRGQGVVALCQLLATDEAAEVRIAVETALSSIPDALACPVLRSLVRYSDPRFRLIAVQQLGTRRDQNSVQALARALHDPDRDVARAADWALSSLGSGESARVLLRAMLTITWPRRFQLFEAIGRGKDASIVPTLIPGLKTGDEIVRTVIARTLGRIGAPSAVPALCEAAGDQSPRVRGAAIGALRRIADAAALPALSAAAGDAHKGVRNNAQEALAKLEWQESVEALVSVLASDSPILQANAARRLGELGDNRAAAALCAALGGLSHEVRSEALRALLRLGRAENTALLVEAIQLHPWRLQVGAARRLGERRESAAIPYLREALHHSNREVVCAAAQALGRIQAVEVIPEISNLLIHAVSEVRLHAADALGAIGHRAAITAIRQRLRTFGGERDAEVRKQMRNSLHRIELGTAAHANLPVPGAGPSIYRTALPVPVAGNEVDPASFVATADESEAGI